MLKSEIRKKMLEQRNQLTTTMQLELSRQITEYVLNSGLYQENEHICVYQAFRNEVSCKWIMEKAFEQQKKVYVPVTNQILKTMNFYRITRQTIWKTGAYGIKEPVLEENQEFLTEKALILMPGLIVDYKKHRIGYGGGYYDKYLSENNQHVKVMLCYHFQRIEENLPSEEYDISPDYVITNKGIF